MAGRPSIIVVCVSSRFTLSVRAGGSPVALGIAGGDSEGLAQPPNRATISRRASSTVTAPTTATIDVSGRTLSR